MSDSSTVHPPHRSGHRQLQCKLPHSSAQLHDLLPQRPWASSWQELAAALEASAERGLDEPEVLRRRERYGTNCLAQAAAQSAWGVLFHQFRSLIVALLAVAAVVSFLSGAHIEGYAVLLVIGINAAIGFFTEIRAIRSMEALRQLGTVPVTVRREGRLREIEAAALVPGDLLVLEAGQIIGADARLVSAANLQVDESTLTGESAPVAKAVEAVSAEAPVAERASMVHRGTALNRGSGLALVTATGPATELGQISELVASASGETTPLEKRLDQLGRRLVWITLGIATVITGLGVVQGRAVLVMLQTGIALAVATIPEGLPIVATTALARGMWRMARRQALINRLSAVETLGATTVVCTDKTGTLTENRMTVRRIVLADGELEISGGAFETDGAFHRDGHPVEIGHEPLLREALELGALCNTAGLPAEGEGGVPAAVGDPLEVALLVAAARADLRREDLLARYPLERQEAFDTDTRMMATIHRARERFMVAVKGAPEQVLAACSSVATPDGDQPLDDLARQTWLNRNETLAADGLRLLAVARKEVASAAAEPYEQLTLIALLGLLDPPREEVSEDLGRARQAGVRVIMVTGDQAATAVQVAEAVGLFSGTGAPPLTGSDLTPAAQWSDSDRRRLLDTSVFARVSPRQKLDLIQLHQEHGAIVAMTGDGVNDAPALKKADIGIAMGQRGTQVAREAADMILLDDSFSSIVFAIEQGRVIFRNLRRFVIYLLSCNVAEIMAVTLAALLGAPLPILPLQILFINLVTDVFPALALGVGEGDPAIMRQPPRDPHEGILSARHWRRIALYGFVITVAVLAALGLSLYWLRLPEASAVTVSFLTLALAQLWHVFNLRDPGANWWRNDIVGNKYIWGALALCLGLLSLALCLPPLARVLSLVCLAPASLLVALSMSLVPLLVGQLILLPLRRAVPRPPGAMP